MAGIPLRTLAYMAEDGDGQADILCARLDSRYDTYRQERKMIEHCMQTVPHDGRPPIVLRSADTVNGQEVRGSDRWQGTPADRVTDAHGRPIDRTCYRLVPPACGIGPVERIPFIAPETAQEPSSGPARRSTARDAAGDYQRLLRLYGTAEDVADRAALADGTA
jgi:hypothetical protein